MIVGNVAKNQWAKKAKGVTSATAHVRLKELGVTLEQGKLKKKLDARWFITSYQKAVRARLPT
jgi:hypothetical protein